MRQFYQLLYAGKDRRLSLDDFEERTGLDPLDEDARRGTAAITQFRNRVLALRIDLQNTLFAASSNCSKPASKW